MKVLVIGGGGREHALVWKLSQSSEVDKVYCAPGNAGIAEMAECVAVPPNEIGALLKLAKQQSIDFTVVGPEEPLILGIVDAFQKEGLRAFGPSMRAAHIEGSKAFAKYLMRKHDIPSAGFKVFETIDSARTHSRTLAPPFVIKADGIAAGKGVFVCQSNEDAEKAIGLMMGQKKFGAAGERVVIEDFLQGEEASILALTDGRTISLLPSSQDHKPIFDGDKGPNTGGMGAYSPAPVVDDNVYDRIERDVILATVHAMNIEERLYRGVLYAGLMIGADGPTVLEYNCRFGDPETQPILMRMKSDLLPALLACAEGRLDAVEMEWDPRPAVCVVMASGGYPGPYQKGKAISGLDEARRLPDVQLFHAGTALKDGQTVTSGGRVLGVTALGDDLEQAIARAYEAVQLIHFDGAQYRSDIGAKALARDESSG